MESKHRLELFGAVGVYGLESRKVRTACSLDLCLAAVNLGLWLGKYVPPQGEALLITSPENEPTIAAQTEQIRVARNLKGDWERQRLGVMFPNSKVLDIYDVVEIVSQVEGYVPLIVLDSFTDLLPKAANQGSEEYAVFCDTLRRIASDRGAMIVFMSGAKLKTDVKHSKLDYLLSLERGIGAEDVPVGTFEATKVQDNRRIARSKMKLNFPLWTAVD